MLALAGDDHGCQSSALVHQSKQMFASAEMPVINPATLQDYLDLGILGFALSRYSGCWVGFKAISKDVESSASIVSDPDRIRITMPDDFETPPGGPSQISNCVSVQPLDTELGRKRRIDQSNCNKDFSCIEGFCPSFATVLDPKLRKADRAAANPTAPFADLPAPVDVHAYRAL